jgi:beta propeller repeat protein
MKRRAVRHWREAALLAAVVALAAWPGGHVVGAEETYGVEHFLIADVRKDQVRPRVSGPWVVWKDYRNLSQRSVDDSPNAQIFGRDLSAGDEVEVAQTKDAGDPAISGTLVVWTAGGTKTTEIHGVDLLDGHVFAVARSTGRQERPAISEQLIVWQDNRFGNWDIFARDLTWESEVAVVEHPAEQSRPAVSGKTVVWEDWRERGQGPDIFALNLETRRETQITRSHEAYEPAISGRWLVWVGIVSQAVYANNLEDGQTLRLSTAAGPKSQPAVSGELVVWTDERHGNRDIYGYDLATGTEFPVVRLGEAQDDPHISGTTVVWSDARGPNRDIVGATLILPRPVETSSATP